MTTCDCGPMCVVENGPAAKAVEPSHQSAAMQTVRSAEFIPLRHPRFAALWNKFHGPLRTFIGSAFLDTLGRGCYHPRRCSPLKTGRGEAEFFSSRLQCCSPDAHRPDPAPCSTANAFWKKANTRKRSNG